METEDYKKKKAWLDYLFYKIGNQGFDFRLSSLKKVGEEVISSKWQRYSALCFPIDLGEEWKLKGVNNREIFPKEVVIDLEDKENYGEVIKRIKEDGLPFYACDTGSKGIHIHIFFKQELEQSQKEFLIKRYGGDLQKAYSGTTIALEFAKHWKSGKVMEVNERWRI